MRKPNPGSAFLVAAGVALLFACGDPLRQDELDCEEAVSVLEGCCPDFQGSRVQCVYTAGCGTATYPDLAIPESQCIRAESCAALVSTGVCARAQDAGTGGTQVATAHRSAVCP